MNIYLVIYDYFDWSLHYLISAKDYDEVLNKAIELITKETYCEESSIDIYKLDTLLLQMKDGVKIIE